jgi:NAD(P)-dependent dehydrogenase (short-subunit alcohol dehydrogenase family)
MDDSGLPSRRLKGKIAIITGSTHGIGLGIAERFAQEGATVVLNDEGAHDGETIANELPGEAIYVEADVLEPTEIEQLIEAVTAEYGRIDTLVNNVGDGQTDHLENLSLEGWNYTMNVCLRSQWLCAKHAIEYMPPGSSIINISSTEANGTVPGFVPYDAAKAGVNGLTRGMAVDLGELGIRANAIEPGGIEIEHPDASDGDLAQDPAIDPAERWGRPADIAPLAAFLASDGSQFITGANIPVDGGRQAVLIDRQYTGRRRIQQQDNE